MIAIDSNVLIRLITKDDPDQARRARDLLSGEAGIHGIFLTTTTVVETVWALRRSYKFSKTEILTILDEMLTNVAFVWERLDAITIAVEDFRNGSADFSDYVIAAIADLAGAKPAYTFDKIAVASGRFVEIPA